MNITVVTPTIFRRSLLATIKAVQPLLRPGDEHLVIVDSLHENANKPVALPTHAQLFVHKYGEPHSCFGNAQRDFAHSIAKGDCIVYIDDDDLPMPDGFDILHWLEPDPNVMHTFNLLRGDSYDGETFYAPLSMWTGNYGGAMLVPPNRPDLPKWTAANEGVERGEPLRHADIEFGMAVENMPGMRIEPHKAYICHQPRPGWGIMHSGEL